MSVKFSNKPIFTLEYYNCMALLSSLQFLLQEVHSSKDTDKPFPLEKNSTHTELAILVLKFSFLPHLGKFTTRPNENNAFFLY